MRRPTYDELIQSGQSSAMAAILSSGRAPGVHGTDTTAFAGFGSLKKQLGRDYDRVTKAAIKRGYNPGSHDVYNPSFAKFEGDPRAFASQAEGLGKFRKLAEESGLGCDGDISVKSTKAPKTRQKGKKLAPDLIGQQVMRRVNENPDLLYASPKKKQDLVDGIIQRHGS